jgi:REP-associated tyrosine transposase
MPRPYNRTLSIIVGVGHARPKFRERNSGFGQPRYVAPRRRSIRLPGFDYSTPGAYFITICTRDRRPMLSAVSEVVTACWNEIPQHFPRVTLDAFVVMPNHLHGILVLDDLGVGPSRPISVVIGAFKAVVSKRLRKAIWQRNYWEHVIRSDKALNQIRQYIEDNPAALIPWTYAGPLLPSAFAPRPTGRPEPPGFRKESH